MTPRELTMLMRAQTERQYDEYERMAYGAWMVENASRMKKPKTTDLFKRPSDEAKKRKSTKELREKLDAQQALLSQFIFTK